jgi:hypothetical protein
LFLLLLFYVELRRKLCQNPKIKQQPSQEGNTKTNRNHNRYTSCWQNRCVKMATKSLESHSTFSETLGIERSKKPSSSHIQIQSAKHGNNSYFTEQSLNTTWKKIMYA